MHVPLGKTAKKRLLRPQGNAFDASPDQNYDLRLGKHSFPRKNCIQLGKVERTLEKNQAIHDFQVLRRKTEHVVRSRSNTCEKISPGGKKELLSVFGSNNPANTQKYFNILEFQMDPKPKTQTSNQTHTGIL